MAAGPNLHGPVLVVGTVRLAWGYLRERAGGGSYPPEPSPPQDYHEAIRALDHVINWCNQAAAAAAACPGASSPQVVLPGLASAPIVRGKQKRTLTFAQYNVVQAPLGAGPAGLSKDDLLARSGHSDAPKVLKRLHRSDPDWAAVLPLPGKSWQGYRVL